MTAAFASENRAEQLESLRRRMQAISKRLQARPGTRRAADLIEEVAEA